MSDITSAALEALDPTVVGANVRAIREEKRWTRFDLGSRTGMRENTLYRIEAGQVLPSLDSIARLAYALGTTVDELIKAGS